MSRFKRIKNKSTKKSSVSIDEKIAALNQELEKTGMLSEIMTTDNVYSTSTYVPPQEPIVSEVPNSSNVGGDGFNQSSASSGTEGDAPTYSSTADLFNTTANATIFPSTNYEGAQGYGVVIGPSFGAGTTYGIIEGGNTYRAVLGGWIAGGTRGPDYYKDIYINKQHANVDNPGTYTTEQIADAKEDWQLAVQVDEILTKIGYDNTLFNVTWKAYRPNRLFEDLSSYPSYNHPTKGTIYLVPFSMLGTKNKYVEQDPRPETTTNPQRRGLEDEPIYPGPIPPGLWPPLSPGGFNWLKKKALTASSDPEIAFFGKKDKDKGIDPKFFKGTTKNILLKYASQIVNDQDWSGKLREKFNKLTNGRITPEKFMELYPKLTNPSIKETEFNKILDDANKSSVDDDLDSFASAGYEPEIGIYELKPEDIPNEFKTDNEDKPSAQGVTLTKWMSRTDFMKQYPDSSMSEFLAALPYGATNFMKPDPNFPGARIVDTAAYERYIMTGNTSGVSGKPRHSKATPEPEEKKWGGKTKEEIIADLEADSAKYSAEEKAAKEEMQRIALELGMDFVSLIGGLFTGGTTAAPVLGKLGMKLLKKYGKTVAGKMIRKLVKRFRNKRNSQQLDDIIDAIEKGGNDSGSVDLPDDGIGPRPVPPKPKKKIPNDMEYNWNPTGGSDGRGQWEVRDIPSPKTTTPKPKTPPKPKKKLPDDMEYYWNKNDGEWRVREKTVGRDYGRGADGKDVIYYNSYKPDGKLLSEAAKLGLYEPEAMNVDLADIRKGVMPEYPKKPPAEMIDGYHQDSKLKPKEFKDKYLLKIDEKDLIRNHRLKPNEAQEMMNTIKMINDHLKKHPEDLIHAQQRYPIDDPRLAELNWKMDQMLEAGEEYLDKNFKENQTLYKRATDRTKNNIKLTDPEYVQQNYNELRGTTQGKVINPKPRDIKLKSKLKKHLPQYESKSFFRHVDSNDYKKISERKEEQKRLKLENETALNKVTKERQEYVNGEMLKQMSDWRKDISESDFTNITKGNRIGQTFQHASGATITLDNTMSDPSDLPSQVTLDLGFGEKITVDAPSGNEYGIAGITSHLGASGGGVKELDKKVMQKQNVKTAKQINRQTDASDEVSKSKSAKLDENLTLEEKKVEVENYKNAMKEYDKKSVERDKILNRRIKSNISKVKSFVGKYGERLSNTYPSGSSDVRIAQGGKTLLVISHSGFNYSDSKKFNVRVYEAKEGKTISKVSGKFGHIEGSIADNPFNQRKSSGEATFMYMNVGGEVENRMFEIKDIETTPIKMPIPPKFMEKNMSKGWQPSATSSFDQEFIDKMKIFAGKNFVSSLAGSNFAAQLSVQLAQGDLTPVTKSPGPAVTNIIKSNIEFTMNTGNTKDLPDFDSKGNKLDPELKKMHSFYNPITGKGAVRYSAYGAFGVGSAPVSASLGQYSIERTDKGMRITDKFDISGGFTAPGGAAYFNGLTQLVGGKDVQSTGDTLTAIAARRAAELGYDMVDADTGETLQPIYAGEEEFNSRNYPNAGAPTIATPKGYNIKIDFTIPWSSFSPQTANLLKIGGKQIVNPLPNKTIQGIKKLSKSKFDGFNRDDVSFKKKKKDIFETNKDIKPEFPKNPPPKLDPKTGMHPQYGKRADRYTKLDSISADSMPLTGDPETDAIVKKQKNKKNFKEWSQQLDSMWKSDWRDELKEGMTTADTFITVSPGQGDTDLITTGTGYQDGIHQLQNIPPMTDVDDPTNVGKKLGGGPIGAGYHNAYGGIGQYTSSTKEAEGEENAYWKQAVSGTTLDDNDNPRYSDYIYPFDRRATGAEIQTAKDASLVRGDNDVFRATYPTNVFSDRHKATPVATNPTVGVDDDYDTVGLGVRWGGAYDTRTPRFFVPAGVNTSEIDTVKILASVPTNNQGVPVMNQAGSQLQLYYWAGDKPGFQSLQNELSHNVSTYPTTKRQFDGWRPIAQKPNGEIDSSVNSNIIDIIKPDGFLGNKVSEFTLQIPEWCRTTNTRFMFIQMSSSNGGPTIYSIRYQRRNALTINTTLEDDISSAYVRAGMDSHLTSAERKKKLEERLRASREYMIRSLGFGDLFKDEIKISDVVSNNFDFQSVMQGSGAFGNSRFHDIIDQKKRQAAAAKYRPRPKTKSRSSKFRGYKRTGRDSKGMTTSARVNPKDIIGSI